MLHTLVHSGASGGEGTEETVTCVVPKSPLFSRSSRSLDAPAASIDMAQPDAARAKMSSQTCGRWQGRVGQYIAEHRGHSRPLES
jgi:hypothetical protein